MFKIKSIDFEKIRSMVDAAERLVDADLQEDAEKTLAKLADFIDACSYQTEGRCGRIKVR